MPGLDGLRGLALLGVLFFHAGGMLPGGFLGVDLFFVLSGYLITSLLVAEHQQTSKIDLVAFWVRRARRLFPALLSLMVAIAVYARWFARADELASLRTEALATLGYVANWRAILSQQSYWDLFSTPSPLEHTWSLAIEEQFYVVWPLLASLLLRRSKSLLLGGAMLLAACSAVALSWLYDPSNTSRVYLGTDTRAAGILLGAAFALLVPPGTVASARAVRRWDLVGGAGLLILGWAWCRLDGDSPWLYRGGLWVTELAALAVIGCAVLSRAGWIVRLLSLSPLRWFGRVSYGAYLWHWPINLVLTSDLLGWSSWLLNSTRFALTFGIAALSFYYFEQPIRRRGVPFGKPWVVAPASVVAVTALLIAATPKPRLTMTLIPETETTTAAKPEDWSLLVLGDSTANALGWVVRGLHLPNVSVTLGGVDGFSLHNDGPKWEDWSKTLAKAKPDATLVVLSGAFLYGMTADDGWRAACYPAWNDTFEVALEKRLRDLKMGAGPKWIATIPYALGPYDNDKFRQRIDCINPLLLRVVEKVGGFEILDLAEMQCPKGHCLRSHDGQQMRPDGVHYDIEGARPIAEQTLKRLR